MIRWLRLILCLVGCASKPTPVSLGYLSTGLTGLAVEVMKQERIPERHGIKFEYLGFETPSEANDALVSGRCQVGLGISACMVALNRAEGHRVQYLFPALSSSGSILVKTDAPYRRLEDLRGKRLGLDGAGAGGYGFYLLTQTLGVDPERAFKLVEAPAANLWGMLFRDEVDAVMLCEPFVTKLLATGGYREVFGPFDKEWQKLTGYAYLDMVGLSAAEDWLDENPALARRLIKAWQETVRELQQNLERALRRYPSYTYLQSDQELNLALARLPGLYRSEWGDGRESIQAMLERLAETGKFLREVPPRVIRRFD